MLTSRAVRRLCVRLRLRMIAARDVQDDYSIAITKAEQLKSTFGAVKTAAYNLLARTLN